MNAKLLLIVCGIAAGASALADEIEQPSEARRSSDGDKYGSAKPAVVSEPTDAAPAARAVQKANTATPETIARWIKQLDSDEYWTREDATKRLFLAGATAVGPLGEAARSEKLEVSTRAVSVLARFLDLDDPQLEFAAENILEEIAAGRVTSAAARAETALAGYRGSRQERALAKLRQLGATVTAMSFSTGDVSSVQIAIGEGWHGTPDDLANLKRIPTLQRLSIYVDSVNDSSLKYLTSLKQLTYLDLFGTSVSENGIQQLEASLKSTRIDRRKGGLLGVTGNADARGGGCLVTSVQADSAADKAGLQPGDMIKKFEGEKVDDFTNLTQLIARKGGGETVELEIERQTQTGDKLEKQTLTKKATLDQWKGPPALSANQLIPNDVQIIIGQ